MSDIEVKGHICAYIRNALNSKWLGQQNSMRLSKMHLIMRKYGIWSICHILEQLSCSFRLSLPGAQCTNEHGSNAILIVPTLVLFSSSICTYMYLLAQTEINSTSGKNSRKYGIYETCTCIFFISKNLQFHDFVENQCLGKMIPK